MFAFPLYSLTFHSLAFISLTIHVHQPSLTIIRRIRIIELKGGVVGDIYSIHEMKCDENGSQVQSMISYIEKKLILC